MTQSCLSRRGSGPEEYWADWPAGTLGSRADIRAFLSDRLSISLNDGKNRHMLPRPRGKRTLVS